jgi:hypothetical protein
MILNSPYITGSLTVTGNTILQGALTVTGSLSGTAATASFALTLQGTGSVGFATTGAFSATSGSASSRLTQIEQVYATTGSNSFRATQSITGSLTVTGQIVAQTLNVQQVTSSIVFSSGSNNFGNQLSNNQTFTGSVNITGSLALAGNITSNGAATFSSSVTATDQIKVSGSGAYLSIYDTQASSKNWAIRAGHDAVGDLAIRQSNSTGGDPISAGTNRLYFSSTGAATFSSTLQSNDLTIKNSANAETLDLFLSPSTSNGFIDYPSGRSLMLRNKGSLGGLTLASTGAATFNLGSGEMRLNRTGTSEYLKANTYYLLTNGNDQYLGSETAGVNIYAGGSPILNITSGGNVLIGKTTNAGGRLQVSNGTITFNVDHNADGAYLTAATDNNVNYRRLSYDATEHLFFTSATERMRITSGGNLEFKGSTSAANGDIRQLGFINTANSANVKAAIVAVNGADSDIMSLSFRTSTSSTNISEKLIIAGSGAATFSSSVTATSAFIGPTSNQVRITSQGTFASSTLNAHIINADGTGAYISGDLLLQPRSSSGGGANNIVFGTSNNTNTVTERMRITSGGYLKASNDAAYLNVTGTYHEFTNNTSATATTVIRNTAGNFTDNVLAVGSSKGSNSNFNQIAAYTSDFTNIVFKVRGDGNAYNVNGVYTSGVSDIKYKEQIVDTSSQWDDIKNLRVVNFKFIKDVKENGNNALRHIGFIAQEVEKVSPKLVEEMTDNSTGETWKTIKTSIIHTKAIKALQECMARIEEQQAQIEELTQKVNSLENK